MNSMGNRGGRNLPHTINKQSDMKGQAGEVDSVTERMSEGVNLSFVDGCSLVCCRTIAYILYSFNSMIESHECL